MIRTLFISVLASLAATAAAAVEEVKPPKPLFADEAPLEITLKADFSDLLRKMEDEPTPYDGELSLDGEDSLAVTLTARGHFRRQKENCRFPPLRLRFPDKPGEGSVFHKQKKLKLVVHCRDRDAYGQLVLLEHTVYKLMNVLSPASFRVRLATISYVDSADGKEIAKRPAFLIEDVDDVAKRLGRKEVEFKQINVGQLSAADAAMVGVFHYMVGNLDWSVLAGRDGDDCCHNGKLIGASAEAVSDLIPLPYDFDHAGLVNAPYATPPEGLGVNSVRSRRYRGFCALNDDARAAIGVAKDRREALYGAINSTPGMTDRTKEKAAKYLDGFFKDVADDRSIDRKLFTRCR